MTSPVKRSVVIGGRNTSVCLEDAFWSGLKEIAASQNVAMSQLVGRINRERQQGNLSSALRLFVLQTFQRQAADAEHGHDASSL